MRALSVFAAAALRRNPAWAQLLGLCPLLAVSNTVANAAGLAAASAVVLVGSATLVAAVRKLIPADVRLPCFVLVIATFTTLVNLAMEAYAFALHQRIALFVQIIVTNCMILGQVERVVSKTPVGRAAIDALGATAGFAAAILILGRGAAVRRARISDRRHAGGRFHDRRPVARGGEHHLNPKRTTPNAPGCSSAAPRRTLNRPPSPRPRPCGCSRSPPRQRCRWHGQSRVRRSLRRTFAASVPLHYPRSQPKIAYLHPIHRRYHAEELVRLRRASEKRRTVSAQRRGRVDSNPHQIDAVAFALQRIPQGGCILADEVGLGKTIEAGLVIAQLLAEGKSRILIIVPRPLLGQWQSELRELFGIEAQEAAHGNVDVAAPSVFIAGREYAGGERGFERLQQAPPFDLCLIDEAHEVFAGIHRRYNKDGTYDENSPHARTAHRVKQLIGIAPVLLLTATPMQNSLDELWALVGYIDRTGTLLGDKPTFDELFNGESNVGAEQAGELQRRLKRVVKRTLRRQAVPYLERPFVGRQARLYPYRMSAAERSLYDDVTEYLLEPELFAFRGSARKLLLIGFHRRMASSNAALAASLAGVAERLRRLLGREGADCAEDLDDLEEDAEDRAALAEAQLDPEEATNIPRLNRAAIQDELERVEDFIRRANALPADSKAEALVKVVKLVLERPSDRRKVLIFTESLTTQGYLRDLLVQKTALAEQDVTLFRGVNDSPRAAAALRVWRERRPNHICGLAPRWPCGWRWCMSFAPAPR